MSQMCFLGGKMNFVFLPQDVYNCEFVSVVFLNRFHRRDLIQFAFFPFWMNLLKHPLHFRHYTLSKIYGEKTNMKNLYNPTPG